MKKVFKYIKKSWKTTITGVAVIGVAILQAKGVIVESLGSAILSGIGLILAKDADKTNTPTNE